MECKEYIYKTCPDGTQVELDVYYPTQPTPDITRFIAIYYHGGGWTTGSKSELPKPHVEKLLKLDFVVVSVNYRLSPTISVWDGAATDALDAYKWCQTKLPQILKEETGGKMIVKGEAIVTIGASAGGPMAALPTKLLNPPKAYMDLYTVKFLSDPGYHQPSDALSFGPASFDEDLVSQIYNEIPPPTSYNMIDPATGMPDFNNPRTAFLFDSARKGVLFSKTIIDGNTSRLDPASFVAELGPKFPPTIILHGVTDTAVPIKYARQMLDLLREKGVSDSELVELEDVGHGFDIVPSPVHLGDEVKERVDKAMQKGFEFLKRHCAR